MTVCAAMILQRPHLAEDWLICKEGGPVGQACNAERIFATEHHLSIYLIPQTAIASFTPCTVSKITYQFGTQSLHARRSRNVFAYRTPCRGQIT